MDKTLNEGFLLVKFFKEKKYRDLLIKGKMHMRSPEYYRKNTLPGVGDPNESSIFSIREKISNDKKPVINFGLVDNISGKVSPPFKLIFKNLTMYDAAVVNGWIQSWFLIPAKFSCINKFNLFKNNIERMKEEFGQYAAIIDGEDFSSFYKLLEKNCSDRLSFSIVKYSPDRTEHNIFCKSEDYSYQNEFRIVMGECPIMEEKDKEFMVKDGFSKIISKSRYLQAKLPSGKYEYIKIGI
ncbi:hypothetical protein AKN87_01670 [Thiopseudomonas alkaliphila]|uniref:Uncharacterized protein n=1 Tax=Thiopseudomonas alkaliphila TaxID=1697053 RepID=A0A0K1XGR4_9GAMM|nr:hypothetical protein [Thiopseudomonas alkaliphila]AKX43960.1 hypothetical protein AKN87_01670 [Thiopseudomonas alkaliphila]AKX46217.1 hypothetical protein AKN94_01650 [Thiopseudomonas alkaliphila]AKX60444.1 hypothetical protein AKN88_11280 [Thiopseudomonas alkaliphila]